MIFIALAENSIQLVPDGSLLIHIALILLMIFALNRTLFKPINKILEERERRTSDGTSGAQGTLKNVEDKLSYYERTLREARENGYRLLEQIRNSALNERQGRISALREELQEALIAEKSAIKTQVEQSRVELKRDATRIAAQISQQILRRPDNEAPQSQN